MGRKKRLEEQEEAQGDSTQGRVEELKELVKRGMPTRREMQEMPLGTLRKHIDWAKRAAPYIAELERLGYPAKTLEHLRDAG